MKVPRAQIGSTRAVRARRRTRLAAVAVTLCTVAVCALAVGGLPGHPTPGVAAAAGTGSSRSQAAAVTQGSGLTLTTRVGFLGALGVLDTVTAPFTSQVVNPILNALVALPNAMTTGLVNGFTGAGLAASNGDTLQPRPGGGGYPQCDQRGWDSSNCYGPVTPGVTVPTTSVAGGVPEIAVTTGSLQGYATADSAGYVAASRASHPSFTVLGFPLGDIGVVGSSASCAAAVATCAATQSLTGGSLAAGGIALSLASGGQLLASVGGVPVGTTAVAVGVAGYAGTTVSVNGNLATITAGLTLPQLLSALGLPTLLTSFTGGLVTDDGSVVKLVMKVGPGAISQSSPASAWGANVSIDLSVALKLKVAGLVSASITSTSTPPSLVGMQLAYSSATAGTPPPGWLAPVVI